MSINLGLTAEDVAIFTSLYARRTASHLTFRADNADYQVMRMCAAHRAAPHPYAWPRAASHHVFMACDPASETPRYACASSRVGLRAMIGCAWRD